MLFETPTIAKLAAKIDCNGADHELVTLLDRIESLSEDEVQEWLKQHDK